MQRHNMQLAAMCSAIVVSIALLTVIDGCSNKSGTAGMAGTRKALRSNPPDATNEFRAVWVSTAYNTDWPSRPDLHHVEQVDQIRAIVKRAADLNFNVILLQVRAFGDRIHRPTTLPEGWVKQEPWSKSLRRGADPGIAASPQYDPLSEWVREAHAQGLQLHAWVNPFRIDTLVEVTQNGKTFTLPILNCTEDTQGDITSYPKYYPYLYLDPKSPSVQKYVLQAIADLTAHGRPTENLNHSSLKRMQAMMVMNNLQPATEPVADGGDDGSVDGIVIDHYLPDDDRNDGTGSAAPLIYATMLQQNPPALKSNDEVRWDWLMKKARKGLLANPILQEQSTASIDTFIQALSGQCKNNNVQFGMSPDDGNKHAVSWYSSGYLDYVIPELYNPATFDQTLQTWLDATPKSDSQMLVAGLFTTKVQVPDKDSDTPWPPAVIEAQIKSAREKSATVGSKVRRLQGQAHFSWSALRDHDHGGPQDGNNIGDVLTKSSGNNTHYDQPALAPEFKNPPPGANPPGQPWTVTLDAANQSVVWTASPEDLKRALRWIVRLHHHTEDTWEVRIVPGKWTSLDGFKDVDSVDVTSVDRYGRKGNPQHS